MEQNEVAVGNFRTTHTLAWLPAIAITGDKEKRGPHPLINQRQPTNDRFGRVMRGSQYSVCLREGTKLPDLQLDNHKIDRLRQYGGVTITRESRCTLQTFSLELLPKPLNTQLTI